MKAIKLFSILATGLIITTATSCSKTYNCHCVYKSNGTVTKEDDYQINEGKKSKSEAKCNEMDSETTQVVGSTSFYNTTECTLQ
jgi:hypothetical protein